MVTGCCGPGCDQATTEYTCTRFTTEPSWVVTGGTSIDDILDYSSYPLAYISNDIEEGSEKNSDSQKPDVPTDRWWKKSPTGIYVWVCRAIPLPDT